jgi:hypothetical protein
MTAGDQVRGFLLGGLAMPFRSLGPHTFFSPQPHPRHRQWLTRFTPRQRRQLVEEDCHARWEVFGVLIGALLFGLTTLLVALVASALY